MRSATCRKYRHGHCSSVQSVPTLFRATPMCLVLCAAYLSHQLAAGDSVAAGCSRERSRLARSVVGMYLQPIYTARKLEIPAACPLSRQRDMYALEQAAIHPFGASGRLVCGICGRQLQNHEEADTHMAAAHSDELDFDRSNKICLADFCDVLRCDAFANAAVPEDARKCDRSRMAQLKARCERELVPPCVPLMYERGLRNVQLESALSAAVVDSLCAQLTCETYWSAGTNASPLNRLPVDPPHRFLHYVMAGIMVVALLVVALLCFVNVLRSRDGPSEIQRLIKEVDDDEFVSSESGAGEGLRRRHLAN